MLAKDFPKDKTTETSPKTRSELSHHLKQNSMSNLVDLITKEQQYPFSEQSCRFDNEGTTRPPVQCWGCGGAHYVKNCPHRKGIEHVSQMHEASIVGDVARSIPKINAALDDH